MSYYLVHTTYLFLFIAVLARQLCLPVPANLFLLSGGALAGSGKLSVSGILFAAVLGCLLADLAWFEAGRLGGKRVMKMLCTFAPDPGNCLHSGREVFKKRGLLILLIAKFVPGLDGISPPMAGMLGSSRTAFIAYDAGGSALWAGAYIGGGFVFARQLDQVANHIPVIATWVVLVLAVPLLLFLIFRLTQLLFMLRHLRPLHIAPELLKSQLEAKAKVGVVDLLRFEEDPEGVAGIPGALRLDPLELRRKKKIVVPPDVDLVLYCRSTNSFVSARVAAAMRKRGIANVHVLAGGLEAWKGLGFPLTAELVDPQAAMTRLGIKVWPPLQNIRSESQTV
jgi:membrane protein DedA with SNARE-associated domain/rhodanese-related sulfurtransferase